jgi:hypothetical protein
VTVRCTIRGGTWGDFTKRHRDRVIAGEEPVIAEERRVAAEDQARARSPGLQMIGELDRRKAMTAMRLQTSWQATAELVSMTSS